MNNSVQTLIYNKINPLLARICAAEVKAKKTEANSTRQKCIGAEHILVL